MAGRGVTAPIAKGLLARAKVSKVTWVRVRVKAVVTVTHVGVRDIEMHAGKDPGRGVGGVVRSAQDSKHWVTKVIGKQEGGGRLWGGAVTQQLLDGKGCGAGRGEGGSGGVVNRVMQVIWHGKGCGAGWGE